PESRSRRKTMLRRLFLVALVGLAALATLTIQTPAVLAQAKATTYAVYYRGKGQPTYHLFGRYAKRDDAVRIAQHLRNHDHFQTEVRASSTPIPKIAPRKPTGLMPVSVTVSPTKAREMFTLMSRQHDIAFRYPIDGCYARAELMIERMRQRKTHPYRVWSVANGEPLHANTRNVKKGYVEGGY